MDAPEPPDPTRRSFIQAGAGVVVGTAALVGAGRQLRVLRDGGDERARLSARDYQPTYSDIELRVNGNARALRVPHQRTLLLALREDLGLTGTKKSCNLGQCGACTVLMDGQPVYSCLLLALDAAGREITTIEGISQDGTLHPIQEGFVRHMGSQCGHCTPGMIMSGVALLQQNPRPTADEVRMALSGNLCRCGNYRNEIAGILFAAGSPDAAAAPALSKATKASPARVSDPRSPRSMRAIKPRARPGSQATSASTLTINSRACSTPKWSVHPMALPTSWRSTTPPHGRCPATAAW